MGPGNILLRKTFLTLPGGSYACSGYVSGGRNWCRSSEDDSKAIPGYATEGWALVLIQIHRGCLCPAELRAALTFIVISEEEWKEAERKVRE